MRKYLYLYFILMAACSPIGENAVPTSYPPTIEATPSPTVVIPTKISSTPSIIALSTTEPLPEPTSTEKNKTKKIYFPDQVQPNPDDSTNLREKAFIETVEIIKNTTDSDSGSIIVIKGTLPSPCHILRAVIQTPINTGQMKIEVYSLSNSGLTCIQVLEPFELDYPLEKLSDGTYSVWINDSEMLKFEWPLE